MAIKVTLIIRAGTQYEDYGDLPGRIGGETESHYLDTNTFPTNGVDLITRLATKRAAFLPKLAQVAGYRWQTIADTAGASSAGDLFLPGSAAFPSDLPQAAIKITAQSQNNLNKKEMELRVIPDSVLTSGEFNPSPAFTAAVRAFLNELTTSGWCFRGVKKDASTAPINYIEDTGVFHLTKDLAYNDGDTLQVLRTKNLANRQKGGFYVCVKVGARTGTLVRWDHGLTSGGKLRLAGIVYPPYKFDTNAVAAAESMVKKVGRPSNGYRGRKSAKSPG